MFRKISRMLNIQRSQEKKALTGFAKSQKASTMFHKVQEVVQVCKQFHSSCMLLGSSERVQKCSVNVFEVLKFPQMVLKCKKSSRFFKQKHLNNSGRPVMFKKVLKSSGRLYNVLQGSTRSHRNPQGPTMFHRVPSVSMRFHRVL